MKAVVLEQIDSPLVVKDVELTPLSVGQVLVKVLVSGLCGSQLHEIRGHKGNAKFLPHLMGHEGCGIVEEVGPGVTTVNVGDKVVMHWRPGSGIESPFLNLLTSRFFTIQVFSPIFKEGMSGSCLQATKKMERAVIQHI